MVNVCVVYIYIYSWVIVTVSLFLCVVCESSSWFFMVGMWLLQDFWRFTPGGANQLALYAGLEVGGLSCRVNSQEKQQKFWWNRVIVRKWSGIEENPIWQGIFFLWGNMIQPWQVRKWSSHIVRKWSNMTSIFFWSGLFHQNGLKLPTTLPGTNRYLAPEKWMVGICTTFPFGLKGPLFGLKGPFSGAFAVSSREEIVLGDVSGQMITTIHRQLVTFLGISLLAPKSSGWGDYSNLPRMFVLI